MSKIYLAKCKTCGAAIAGEVLECEGYKAKQDDIAQTIGTWLMRGDTVELVETDRVVVGPHKDDCCVR